jgi:signal transduction histidine kinase
VPPLRRAVADALWRAPAGAPRGWPRRRRRQVLAVAVWVVLAAGYTGGAIGEMATRHVSPIVYPLVGLAQAAPLAIAARWPIAAWRIMMVGLFAGAVAFRGGHFFWPWPVTSWLAIAFVLIQVRIGYDRATAVGAGVATALVAIAPSVVLDGVRVWFALVLCGILAVAVALGDLISGRYAAEASLAELDELRRRDLARQAVLEERARIARELHDVVAHHMSVIALQAAAAPYKIKSLPPDAHRTFDVIVDSARAALAETRRVVGLLREEDEAAERLPQPGLDGLDGLIEAARSAGINVQSRIVGLPRPTPAGLDLSAYRIVQEALSNAARYAPGATVQVTVHYGDERLSVCVSDDGTAVQQAPEPGGGHGLVGMRERAAMLGGVLRAGPRAGGGFAVTAELPYGAGGYGDP